MVTTGMNWLKKISNINSAAKPSRIRESFVGGDSLDIQRSPSQKKLSEKQLSPNDENIPKYKKSPISDSNITTIIEKLRIAMTEEKLYLDNDLSLTKLAQQIDVKTHHISQVLNQELQKKFFDFVNQHRIDNAKRLLSIENRNSSIFDIAIESGFNSKNTFYLAFKKNTGMTPFQYKRKCIESAAKNTERGSVYAQPD